MHYTYTFGYNISDVRDYVHYLKFKTDCVSFTNFILRRLHRKYKF